MISSGRTGDVSQIVFNPDLIHALAGSPVPENLDGTEIDTSETSGAAALAAQGPDVFEGVDPLVWHAMQREQTNFLSAAAAHQDERSHVQSAHPADEAAIPATSQAATTEPVAERVAKLVDTALYTRFPPEPRIEAVSKIGETLEVALRAAGLPEAPGQISSDIEACYAGLFKILNETLNERVRSRVITLLKTVGGSQYIIENVLPKLISWALQNPEVPTEHREDIYSFAMAFFARTSNAIADLARSGNMHAVRFLATRPHAFSLLLDIAEETGNEEIATKTWDFLLCAIAARERSASVYDQYIVRFACLAAFHDLAFEARRHIPRSSIESLAVIIRKTPHDEVRNWAIDCLRKLPVSELKKVIQMKTEDGTCERLLPAVIGALESKIQKFVFEDYDEIKNLLDELIGSDQFDGNVKTLAIAAKKHIEQVLMEAEEIKHSTLRRLFDDAKSGHYDREEIAIAVFAGIIRYGRFVPAGYSEEVTVAAPLYSQVISFLHSLAKRYEAFPEFTIRVTSLLMEDLLKQGTDYFQGIATLVREFGQENVRSAILSLQLPPAQKVRLLEMI